MLTSSMPGWAICSKNSIHGSWRNIIVCIVQIKNFINSVIDRIKNKSSRAITVLHSTWLYCRGWLNFDSCFLDQGKIPSKKKADCLVEFESRWRYVKQLSQIPNLTWFGFFLEWKESLFIVKNVNWYSLSTKEWVLKSYK